MPKTTKIKNNFVKNVYENDIYLEKYVILNMIFPQKNS